MTRHGDVAPATDFCVGPRGGTAAPGRRGKVPAQPEIDLTVYLKELGPRRRQGSGAAIAELSSRVTREQLKKRREKELKSRIAKIRRYAKQYGMTVVDADPCSRRVRLRARSADVEKTFATTFRDVEHQGRRCRYAARRPRVPRHFAEIVQAVLGFDQRPRLSGLHDQVQTQGVKGLYPSAIAELYGVAPGRRAAGQCIALVEPAGGYDLDDLRAACKAMNFPLPMVSDIPVGKGRNAFGANPEADKEVSLDVQVLAGAAPGARLAIYFTEDTESGLADGVTAAVHDTAHRPTVIVMTWGEPEANWSPEGRAALDAALADAVRLGITVVAAAGDNLATDGLVDNKAHVDYPASSPYVLGCGGTQITLDAPRAAIVDEVVWNERLRGTGGGISDIYAVPAYQRSTQLPPSVNGGRKGRGVPDVAAAASETNGYRIYLHGSEIVAGGTSAAAPLWAAIIALLNAQRGQSVGFVNPTLYDEPSLFRPIVSGDNAVFGIGYEAGPGWNACTGLGAPRGATLISSLTAVA